MMCHKEDNIRQYCDRNWLEGTSLDQLSMENLTKEVTCEQNEVSAGGKKWGKSVLSRRNLQGEHPGEGPGSLVYMGTEGPVPWSVTRTPRTVASQRAGGGQVMEGLPECGKGLRFYSRCSEEGLSKKVTARSSRRGAVVNESD